ncbi:fatty acid hydroxylase domain-containing protein 2-like [Tubulanus polymorphus]|uniref:fatty acid hydroxylase domain-containing protein 2-like n=1 Tax=Tubulanus polymorphus TaxID=672921 RepID=UPI003DA212FC
MNIFRIISEKIRTTAKQRVHRVTICENQRFQFIDSVKKAAFIIGASLVVFVTFKNTLVWHLQRIWGCSASLWQSMFDHTYALFGSSDFNVAIWGTTVICMAVFWTANIFLIIVDLTGKPEFFYNYKIQPKENVPVDPKRLKKAVLVVLFNQLVIIPLFLIVAFYFCEMRGCQFHGDLPTLQWVVLELIVFVFVLEAFFYYSHRILHHPRLYKYIHKIHHDWTAPIGMVSIYSHPIEHIFSTLLPTIMGPLLMGSHIATAWMWFTIALLSTTNAHSGYHLPLMPSPEAHDYHHLKFNQCYGVLGVLDWLHGTDSLFRESKAYQRHYTLLNTEPLSKQYPDDPKKESATATTPNAKEQ